ncbi:hypothetical protein CTRI78_v002944 [Colletotrichum trifolii]|uniref:Uncharacterized protein n=1 Tax=Colletotrichum trifolii TaxID=5466 RepID=A0A4V3HWV7_COLTR|nr:hypothetical protein CTRI78_v002944 [Colletotrichum trifolii]
MHHKLHLAWFMHRTVWFEVVPTPTCLTLPQGPRYTWQINRHLAKKPGSGFLRASGVDSKSRKCLEGGNLHLQRILHRYRLPRLGSQAFGIQQHSRDAIMGDALPFSLPFVSSEPETLPIARYSNTGQTPD